jgi:hypothetical protein
MLGWAGKGSYPTQTFAHQMWQRQQHFRIPTAMVIRGDYGFGTHSPRPFQLVFERFDTYSILTRVGAKEQAPKSIHRFLL